MHIIEVLIHQYLDKVQKGEASIDEALFSSFSESITRNLKRQFIREPKKFTLRMSNIGKPSCQLEYEALGVQGDYIPVDIIRNLYGDISERILMFIMYAAGVPIISEQEQVSLEIAGMTVQGTLDLVIDFGNDPRVWDIKSASDWTFKNKFNKSFEEIVKNDSFGYGDQLCMYAEGRRCNIGGFIVFNRSSAEIRVIEAPKEQQLFRETSLRNIEVKLNQINSNRQLHGSDPQTEYKSKPVQSNKYDISSNLRADVSNGDNISTDAATTITQAVSRCFEPIPEYFRSRPTGNTTATIQCSFCSYKYHCWPMIRLLPQAHSKAVNPKLVWYIDYKEQE